MKNSRSVIHCPITLSLLLTMFFTPIGGKVNYDVLITSNGVSSSLYQKSLLGLMATTYISNHFQPIQALINNTGILQNYKIYTSNSWPEVVTIGMWSSDEVDDVVLSTSFDWDPANDHHAHLFNLIPSGVFTITQSLATGNNPLAATSSDYNHDGLNDLAVINQDDDTLGIFLGNGSELGVMQTYATGNTPDGVATGDFNGDFLDDLAVTHATSQSVAIFLQRSSGGFGAPVYYALGSGGFNDLAAGDLNGDGYDDLAVLRGAGYTENQAAIFYQNAGSLSAPIFRTAEDGGFLAHGIAVGDVTGDGRADVVVTAGGNTPHAYLNVFVQGSDGSLAATPVVYPAYHLPESVQVGDVNHDGRNDVLAVHAGWMTISVFLQNAGGTLDAYESYALPYRDFYRPDSLALGDVSGDGGLDVLVANASSVAAENGLVVLENSASAPTSTITLPVQGMHVAGPVYTIQGTASANAVTLQISTDGGLTWVSQPASTTWTYQWNFPGVVQSHILILARAIDAIGRVQSPPAQVRVNVSQVSMFLPMIRR